MVKVLYVLNGTFERGGTEAVVLNYYRNIDHSRVQIDFMLHTSIEESMKNDTCKEVRASGAKIYCVTPRHQSIKKNKEEIENVFKNNKYDIIHTHTDCVGAYILRIARKANAGIRVAHSHATNVPVKVNGVKSFLHFLYLQYCRYDIRKQANYYMACSREAAIWLFGRHAVDQKKVALLNNAIDIEIYKKNSEIRDRVRQQLNLKDELVIGHVGRFAVEKNHEFLIDVFSKVHSECSKTKLLLVGTGELELRIKEKVHQLSLDDAVIFYGTTSKPNELLQAMDVFAFPSRWEGLGIALIEAQAAGLPCVVTDNERVSKKSAITDLVIYVPIDDEKLWVKKILEGSKREKKDTSNMIREAGYDIHIEADKLAAYYEALIKRNC